MIGSTSDFITPLIWGLFSSVFVISLYIGALLSLGFLLTYIFSPDER